MLQHGVSGWMWCHVIDWHLVGSRFLSLLRTVRENKWIHYQENTTVLFIYYRQFKHSMCNKVCTVVDICLWWCVWTERAGYLQTAWSEENDNWGCDATVSRSINQCVCVCPGFSGGGGHWSNALVSDRLITAAGQCWLVHNPGIVFWCWIGQLVLRFLLTFVSAPSTRLNLTNTANFPNEKYLCTW